MRGASPASCASSDALFGYRVNSPRADLSFDRRDSAPGMIEGGGDRRQLQLGRRSAARRAVGRHGDLRGPPARASACCARTCSPNERGTFAALGDPQFIDHLRRLGVTTRRAAAGPRLRAGPPPAAEGPAQLLGLQHHRLLRARAALSLRQHGRRDAHRRPPPARRRHRGRSSTSSTTTPPRATSWARRCRSAASTTRATTAWSPTIRAIASTTPAPATRSTSRTRASCRW